MSASCVRRRWSRCCCCCSSRWPNIGVPINPISAAILALVMNTSAFNCEVWRAALVNFPKEQYEAAQSVGMTAALRFSPDRPAADCAGQPAWPRQRDVAADQGDAGAAVVGVVDITRAAVRIGAETYEPLPPFLVAVALYARSSSCWCPCSAGSNGARPRPRLRHDP